MLRADGAYRIVSDQAGSVRLVLRADTGGVVQRLDTDEFGVLLADTNPGFQPFGFAGGLIDPDTGLVHFDAREYDPTTGRFTTRDPLLFRGSRSNLYEYAGSDPVNRVDPTGLNGGGIIITATGELGQVGGVGGTAAVGVGVFVSGDTGAGSFGTFDSYGGFAGGPQFGTSFPSGLDYADGPGNGSNFVYGNAVGIGYGFFFTTADCLEAISGWSRNRSLNLSFAKLSVGISYSWSDTAQTLSITTGPSLPGADISSYPTWTDTY